MAGGTGQYPKRRETDTQQAARLEKLKERTPVVTSESGRIVYVERFYDDSEYRKKFVPIEERKNRGL